MNVCPLEIIQGAFWGLGPPSLELDVNFAALAKYYGENQY